MSNDSTPVAVGGGTSVLPPAAPGRTTARMANLLRRRRRQLLALVGVAAVLVFLLWPLFVLLEEPVGELGRMWDRLTDDSTLGPALRNTVLLAIGSVTLTLVLATALAWCTVQLPPGRLSALASVIAVTPLAMPSLAAIIGWIFLFSPGIGYGNALLRRLPFVNVDEGPLNVYGLPAIIGVTSVHLVPFVYLFVLNALRNIDAGLEDAARVSGASWFRVQWSIVLRSIRPSLLYGTVIVLMLGLGQFTAPLLLGDAKIDVLTTLMFRNTQNVPPDYSYASFLAVPLVLTGLALVLIQRKLVGKVSRYANVGKGAGRQRRRRRWPIIPVIGFGLFTVVPPLVGLLIVAMSQFWTKNVTFESLDLDNLTRWLDQPAFRDALMNSLRFAGAAVVLTLVLGFLVALFLHRRQGFTRDVLDYAVTLPLTVPGIIFGMGIFVAYALGPAGLYGSSILFLIAYTILALPHAVRIISGGLAQIGTAPMLAARVSGAGPIRSTTRILLPLLRSSLSGAAIIGFVIMVQEFSAAALLRTSKTHVLSTRLYERWEFGGYPEVAAIALAMVTLSMLGVALILVLGGRSALER